MSRLLSLFKRVKDIQARRPRVRPARPRIRLGVEHLEDRCVPAVITEFNPLPTLDAAPTAITKANDGSMWFTEKGANKLGRMSGGVLTEYVIPTVASAPEQITASPDGWVWFTERNGRKIGRINQAGGSIAEFRLTGFGEFPTAITTRADGTVWFASNQQPNLARLGKITASGVISMLPVGASNTLITSLVGGPDGNLWVTQVSATWGDGIAKVTTSGWGTFTNYRLPAAVSRPQSITVGPGGDLWFTEKTTSKIGRITTTGVLTEYALPAGREPQTIVKGPDGAAWFTEPGANQIGRITTTGVVTEYGVPTADSRPFGITVGPNGRLWFTEQSGNKLGEVVL